MISLLKKASCMLALIGTLQARTISITVINRLDHTVTVKPAFSGAARDAQEQEQFPLTPQQSKTIDFEWNEEAANIQFWVMDLILTPQGPVHCHERTIEVPAGDQDAASTVTLIDNPEVVAHYRAIGADQPLAYDEAQAESLDMRRMVQVVTNGIRQPPLD